MILKTLLRHKEEKESFGEITRQLHEKAYREKYPSAIAVLESGVIDRGDSDIVKEYKSQGYKLIDIDYYGEFAMNGEDNEQGSILVFVKEETTEDSLVSPDKKYETELSEERIRRGFKNALSNIGMLDPNF